MNSKKQGPGGNKTCPALPSHSVASLGTELQTPNFSGGSAGSLPEATLPSWPCKSFSWETRLGPENATPFKMDSSLHGILPWSFDHVGPKMQAQSVKALFFYHAPMTIWNAGHAVRGARWYLGWMEKGSDVWPGTRVFSPRMIKWSMEKLLTKYIEFGMMVRGWGDNDKQERPLKGKTNENRLR